MRVLCALMIVMCSTLLGLGKASGLKRRAAVLSDLVSGMGMLKAEICGRRAPMPEIASELAKTAPGCAGRLFSELDRLMPELGEKGLDVIWTLALSALETGAEEQDVLTRLGAALGRYDCEGQGREIELCSKRLARLEHEARVEAIAGGKLYTGLGLTVGIMAAVVFI